MPKTVSSEEVGRIGGGAVAEALTAATAKLEAEQRAAFRRAETMTDGAAATLPIYIDLNRDGIADYRQAWFLTGALDGLSWLAVALLPRHTVVWRLADAYRRQLKPRLEGVAA